jgi:hypothetical protein
MEQLTGEQRNLHTKIGMQILEEENSIKNSFLTRDYLEDRDFNQAVENAGKTVLENEIQRLRSEVEKQGSTVAAKRVLGTKIQILRNNIEKLVELTKKEKQEVRNRTRDYYMRQQPMTKEGPFNEETYGATLVEGRRGGRRKTRSKKTKRSKRTRGRR